MIIDPDKAKRGDNPYLPTPVDALDQTVLEPDIL